MSKLHDDIEAMKRPFANARGLNIKEQILAFAAFDAAIAAIHQHEAEVVGENEYIASMLEKHADHASRFQPDTEVIETRWVKLFNPRPRQVSAKVVERAYDMGWLDNESGKSHNWMKAKAALTALDQSNKG